MGAKHIAAEWATYAEHILPKNAPPIQVQETRRAFYAGAGAILHHILRLADPGEEPTETDLRMMDDIEVEIEEWLVDMEAGRR
jgi:hypothetical protein